MKNKSFSTEILDFYATYNFYIAGKINENTAFEMIEKMEHQFPVDDIRLSDGTRIWNLLRIFFYSNFQSQREIPEMKFNRGFLKKSAYFLKESLSPIGIPDKKITIYGFSGSENRRLRNRSFYDIYMDPIYDIIGDNFCVFEWPTDQGYRRKYDVDIYSKNYVPIHIPTKTLWQLALYKLGKTNLPIENEKILFDVIKKFNEIASLENKKLKKDVYDFIAVFFYVKMFLYNLLRKLNPKVVLLRCGYNRLHMALSQVCKELHIPSIELQHGLITKYHPGYIKTMESKNMDCMPDYLVTYGKTFSEIVKNGNLFDKKKVIDIGFLYLDKVVTSPVILDDAMKKFLKDFDRSILITSQWILAKEIKEFVVELAEEIRKKMLNVGIIIKPHPNDHSKYSDVNHKNIFVADKYYDTYEILKVVDVHSTVYSTTGIESLAFGKPNIFMDIKGIYKNVKNEEVYIVSTPKQFIEKLECVIANYESISGEILKSSEFFFKPNVKKNFKKFFKSIDKGI